MRKMGYQDLCFIVPFLLSKNFVEKIIFSRFIRRIHLVMDLRPLL